MWVLAVWRHNKPKWRDIWDIYKFENGIHTEGVYTTQIRQHTGLALCTYWVSPRYATIPILLCVDAVSVLQKHNMIMMCKYSPRIWYGGPTLWMLLLLNQPYIYYITIMSQPRHFPKVRISLLYICGLGLFRVLCVYTILTGHANLTNECRGVLLVTSYMCPLRTKI